jgi:hypothetical protein
MGIGAQGLCARVGGRFGMLLRLEVPRVTAAGLRIIAIGLRLLEERSPVASLRPALPAAVPLGPVEW